MTKAVTAGIDIGGIDTEIGLSDAKGNIYWKEQLVTGRFGNPDDFIRACADIIKKLGDSHDVEVKAIGVAAPNGNAYRGTIENPVNLPWKGIIPFAKNMQEITGLPTALTNDANAAAIGEKVFGGARDMNNFIVITLGAGLGSGIYCNGEILNGHLGIAGELGHMIVEENGRMCNTQRKGCLEAYASVTGIKRTVFSLLSSSVEKSILRALSFEDLTGEHITKAAAAGDPIALEAFEYTGRILGKALANAISVLDPEAVFVAGGLARAGDFLFKPTRKYINENVFPAFEGKVPLIPSALLDANGGLAGACALAWAKLRNDKA